MSRLIGMFCTGQRCDCSEVTLVSLLESLGSLDCPGIQAHNLHRVWFGFGNPSPNYTLASTVDQDTRVCFEIIVSW